MPIAAVGDLPNVTKNTGMATLRADQLGHGRVASSTNKDGKGGRMAKVQMGWRKQGLMDQEWRLRQTHNLVAAHRVLRASMTGVRRSLSSAAMWDAHFLAVSTRA